MSPASLHDCSPDCTCCSCDIVAQPKLERTRKRRAPITITAFVSATILVACGALLVIATTHTNHSAIVTRRRWRRKLLVKVRKIRRRLTEPVDDADHDQRHLKGTPWYQTGSPWYDSIYQFPCYRTVAGTFDTMDDMVEKYPNLAQVKVIGTSYLGEDLRVLKLTNTQSRIPVKRRGQLFATFGIHSRELGPPELGTRFAEWLLDGYDNDADRTWVLDYNIIHLLMIANPDGRYITEDYPEAYHRKNGNDSAGRRCGAGGQTGVDLNRNFGFMWGQDLGSSGNPCSETYRGSRAQSERETKAIASYAATVFPRGQRRRRADRKYFRPLAARTKGMYLDVHAYGELLIYPFGFTRYERVPGANWDWYRNLARKLKRYNDYTISASGLDTFLYEVSGDTVDYFHGKVGVASMLFEIGTDFLQDCYTFDNKIVEDNLFALFYAAKVARYPFKAPGGIDVKKITLSNLGVTIATDTLYVDVEMDDLEGMNILTSQARDINLCVDAHPYDRPKPKCIQMTRTMPTKASGRVDTTDLVAGRHTVCVQVINRKGIPGACSCEFFQVR